MNFKKQGIYLYIIFVEMVLEILKNVFFLLIYSSEEAVATATEAFEEFNHVFENIKKYGHLFSNLRENVSKRNKDRSVHPEIEWEAKVRKSNELCEQEKKFLNERIPYIR